jgi:hypothetical protein
VLKGTLAEASWQQMKVDYEAVEKTLPAEQRQPRIKRQRPCDDVPFTRETLVRDERALAQLVVPGWPV